jgi:hypothetical protein
MRSKPPDCETFARTKAAALLVLMCAATAACKSSNDFSYTNLPKGYHWRAVYDRSTNAIVFYGRDPFSLDTVYVGPDSRFFVFHHPGTIGPNDLKHPWQPHDAR